jgi:hypothetical protein
MLMKPQQGSDVKNDARQKALLLHYAVDEVFEFFYSVSLTPKKVQQMDMPQIKSDKAQVSHPSQQNI